MEFLDIDDRVAEVRGRIAEAAKRGGHGQDVRLIAVTKTYANAAVEAAWAAGVRDVGENKVQEALGKQLAVRGEAVGMRWHLIGHLQRNKVKNVGHFVLLHSLDSSRLADEVAEMGRRAGVPVAALMQVNAAGEESKGGYEPREVEREAERLRGLEGLRVAGIMTMAPLGAGEAILRRVFRSARGARDALARHGHPAEELSMGMSADYELAVEEGATMVRLGTVLFGVRA